MPGSNLQVPFALDYENKNRGTTRGLLDTGKVFFYTISLCGSIGALSAMCFDSVDSPVVGIGLAAGLGGALFGFGFETANSRDPIQSDYDYIKKQLTNSDILR